MTNYDFIWGDAQKNWSPVDFREKHILNALTVFTWVGMVGAFVAVAFAFLTASGPAAVAFIVFMVLWVSCGIAAIRIRRSKRKLITPSQWSA